MLPTIRFRPNQLLDLVTQTLEQKQPSWRQEAQLDQLTEQQRQLEEQLLATYWSANSYLAFTLRNLLMGPRPILHQQLVIHQQLDTVSASLKIVGLKSITNQDKLLVVKAGFSLASAIHELTVGLYVTNQLRSLVPNFAYVYGWLSRTSEESEDLPLYVGNPQNDWLVIYEYVPGPTFKQYCQSCTKEQFIKAYLQVLLALATAQTYDFCHYDLHHGNVIIRPSQTTIAYSRPWSVRLTVEGIATLIDYDDAHVKFSSNNRKYSLGTYTLPQWGVYPQQSKPLYDAFKLLGFLAREVLGLERWDLAAVVRYCLGYFVDLTGLSNQQLLVWLEDYGQFLYALNVDLPQDYSLIGYLQYLQVNPEIWLVD